MEYVGKFHLQIKHPNYQEKYTSLNDCFYYQPIKDEYMSVYSFDSIEEAKKAYIAYRTKPVYHEVPSISSDLTE